MSSCQEFEGKVALVTGSSSGIGEAVAIELARRGALVSITGRRADKLEEVAKKCQEASPTKRQPVTTIGDVTNEDDNVRLLENTLAAYGKLDILVNNAGVFPAPLEVEKATMETFDQVINTNLRSVYHLTKLAIPHLKKTKGNIINISSNCAFLALPKVVSYCMSKAGVDHLTRCLAAELAPHGIRVNAINPGPVYTDVLRQVVSDPEESRKLFDTFVTPLGRVGDPVDIANIVNFYASDKASFITGAFITADGGMSLKMGSVSVDKNRTEKKNIFE